MRVRPAGMQGLRRAGCVIAAILIAQGCFTDARAETDDRTLIAGLHADPPPACAAKPVGDMSSGIAIFPDGRTDEQLRGVMGWMATMLLDRGRELLAPANTTTVYTAVFYQDAPVNEVGIYGYEFSIPITQDMFEAAPGGNGRFIVIGEHLLLLLWHESLDRTAACFHALEEKLLSLQGSARAHD